MARLDEAYIDGQLSAGEHVDRLERARAAVTVGDLDDVLSDLRLPAAPTARPRGSRTGARVVIGVVAVLVLVATIFGVVAWLSAESTPDRPAAGAPAPEAERLVGGEMFTAAGLDEVVGAIRKRFGTTVIKGVHFYRDRAEVWVPEASSPTGSARYAYSLGGDFHSRQVYSGQSVSSDPAARVDMAKLDTARVAALIASAPEKLGLTTANLAPSLLFRVTVGGDGGGEIWMGINGIGIDSHLVAGLDGSIKGAHRCGWGC